MKDYFYILAFCLVGLIFYIGGIRTAEAEHQCEPVPKHNKLIKVNDTLYYRIHVRVDTSYFIKK